MICFKQPRRTAEADSYPRIEMTPPHKDGGLSVEEPRLKTANLGSSNRRHVSDEDER